VIENDNPDKSKNYQVKLAQDSITTMADALYLDLPVGTGFSYGSGDTDVLTDLDSVSTEFVNFMDTFLKMYPE
jgi:carboxypeptidase C (cathepsin A)